MSETAQPSVTTSAWPTTRRAAPSAGPAAVLVSDFDGTMTANDFYKLAAARLLPPDALAPWAEYLAGRLTHFEALRDIFARLRAPEAELLALVADMAPDPLLAGCVERLDAAGWSVVVASAGCAWYIERILDELRLSSRVEVHANPGVYDPRTGLRMSPPPSDSPFFCRETGVDKAAIVRFHQARGAAVAFAGDGFADEPAALNVVPHLRFARADLARALADRGEPFRPFARWADVAEALLAGTHLTLKRGGDA